MTVALQISAAPQAPSRNDPDNFDVEGDAFLSYLETQFVPQLNAVSTQINAQADAAVAAAATATAKRNEASDFRDTAVAAAGTATDAAGASVAAKIAAEAAASVAVEGAAFTDTNAVVKGSVDATKKLRFEVDGFSTGQTRVATPPDANFIMAGTDLQQAFTKPQRPSLSGETAPAANAVTWALATDSIFRINLSANITTFNLTGTLANLAGYQYRVNVRFNGGTTISWPATVKWAAGTAPTLTGTSGKLDLFTFEVATTDGTNYYLCEIGRTQNVG